MRGKRWEGHFWAINLFGSNVKEVAGTGCLWLCGGASLVVLFGVMAYLLSRGAAYVTPEFLLGWPRQMGREGGIFPTIVATIIITGLAVVLTLPTSLATAIYISEEDFHPKLSRALRLVVDVLAAIPSIVWGLAGLSFFVFYLHWGWSVLSGAIVLSFMILPTVARITEAAMRAVPSELTLGSIALGATRRQTLFTVIIPISLPALYAGLLLALGRAVGETAAVMMTVGGALQIPLSPLDSARPMSLHLYLLAYEGLSLPRAFGTACVLLSFVGILNLAAGSLQRKTAAARLWL